MKQRGGVEKCMSIFDLKIGKAICLSESVLARVMFIYDKKENIKTFTVLDNQISMCVSRRITSWLEENMGNHESLYSLTAQNLDADRFHEAVESAN